MTDLDRLVLGLQQRIKQLEDDVVMLEKAKSNLYAAVSLRIIELEFAEIQDLLNKLNRTTSDYHHQGVQAAAQVSCCTKKSSTSSITPYSTSYPYGAWGRDVKPAPGDENKYWLVVLTSSNVYAHYVRQYSTLSTLLLGLGPKDTYISNSNPTTNTIQGPNMVMYANALYYNCYYTSSICQFNMTTRAISTVALPSDTGYNNKFPFGHLATSYSYTDMDFATDESGVYVIYGTTSNFGNVVISKIETSNPPVLGQTWKTSLYKITATNTFMVCGVLYATRYLDKETEQIFYSYDTKTNKERYDLKINIKKMQTNIEFLNYDPRDHLLYVYSDAYILTYELIFQ
uniref:Si:ch211-194m7.5 n=1 Tax=Cyprinus carpio TaxID=7962 RepID=A0A8C1Z3X0_CYPCA